MTLQRPDMAAAEHLKQAEILVAQGQKQIERQAQFILRLEQVGENSALAREVLAVLKDTQAMRVAARDRLLHELLRDQIYVSGLD
jgi:hypothetical protein